MLSVVTVRHRGQRERPGISSARRTTVWRQIGLTYKDSTAVKPKLKTPQTFGIEDAPNILLVLIDDCGFGQMGTFGGGIPTPSLDRVAKSGLR